MRWNYSVLNCSLYIRHSVYSIPRLQYFTLYNKCGSGRVYWLTRYWLGRYRTVPQVDTSQVQKVARASPHRDQASTKHGTREHDIRQGGWCQRVDGQFAEGAQFLGMDDKHDEVRV